MGPKLMSVLGLYNYWIFSILMVLGLYVVIAHGNLIKKIIGLNIFQASVFLFFISLGKVNKGVAPIVTHENSFHDGILYSNPLPHVLNLTAIVVGVSTTALALSLIVRIFSRHGTIEDEELHKSEYNQ